MGLICYTSMSVTAVVYYQSTEILETTWIWRSTISSWWFSQAHHKFRKSSRASWDWAESLAHKRSRSTINSHPCLAHEPSHTEVEAALSLLWLHQPMGVYCRTLCYTRVSLGLCSHYPCSTHTDIQTTSDTSNSLHAWKSCIFQV